MISKEAIVRVFKDNPSLDKVYFTSDETPFINENDARSKSFDLKDKTITPAEREAELVVETRKAAELIAEIEAIADLEAFNAYELPSGEARVTVIAAYDKKAEEFKIED